MPASDSPAGFADAIPPFFVPDRPDPAPLWEPRSILDGIDLSGPPPTPELLGLGYAGKMHLVSGRPEAAKTWLGLLFVVAAVCRGGSALILDADGTGQRDLALRLRDMTWRDKGVDQRLTPEQLALVQFEDDPWAMLGIDARRDRLLAWIDAAPPPVVVVIDSANPAVVSLGIELNEAGWAAFETRVIKPLKQRGVYVVIPDHLAMSADLDSPYSIQTQRKHASSDVHLRMTSFGAPLSRESPPARYQLRGMKDRPAGIPRHGRKQIVGEIIFTPDGEGGVVAEVDLSVREPTDAVGAAGGDWVPTGIMRKLSDALEARTDHPTTRAMRELGGKKAVHTDAAVEALQVRGHLEIYRDGPAYRHRLVRPYTEQDATRDQGASGQGAAHDEGDIERWEEMAELGD